MEAGSTNRKESYRVDCEMSMKVRGAVTSRSKSLLRLDRRKQGSEYYTRNTRLVIF